MQMRIQLKQKTVFPLQCGEQLQYIFVSISRRKDDKAQSRARDELIYKTHKRTECRGGSRGGRGGQDPPPLFIHQKKI